MKPYSHGAGWSDDRVETLKKLWAEGLSASHIAKTLGGITRNSVIGKAHRLGLVKTESVKQANTQVYSAAARRAAKARKAAETPARPTPPVTPAPLVELPPEGPGSATPLTLCRHQCKWPIGDPLEPGFTYCGRPSVGSYCAGHRQIANQPAKAQTADTLMRSLRRYV